VGIRCADNAAPSIRKSWHWLRRHAAAARSAIMLEYSVLLWQFLASVSGTSSLPRLQWDSELYKLCILIMETDLPEETANRRHRPSSHPLFASRLACVFLWYLWVEATSRMPCTGYISSLSLSAAAVCMKTASSEHKPELVFHFFADRESDSVLYTALHNWCGFLRIVLAFGMGQLCSPPQEIYGLFPTPQTLYFCISCAIASFL
jgi:hypothetical protein